MELYMGKLLTLVALLLSIDVSATTNGHPIGYPDDAMWHPPKVEKLNIFWCAQYGAGLKLQFPEPELDSCISATNEHVANYWIARHKYKPRFSFTNASCSLREGSTAIDCTVFYSIYIDEETTNYTSYTYLARYKWQDAGLSEDIPKCPPSEELKAYDFAYDYDGDGVTDRCYNPADKLKERLAADLPQCPGDTYTLNSSDELKVKQAIQDLLDQLASIESDFSSPNSVNACQLNSLAQLFGISDYTNPNFEILTNSISRSLANIKGRLESALLDLSGAGLEPRYLVQENYSGVVRASHCRRTNDTYPYGDDDIVFVDRYLEDYGVKTDYDESFRMDLMHEIHHSLGAKHPKRKNHTEYSVKMYRSDFENQVSLIKNNMHKDFATPSWVAERYQQLLRNPYNLVWAIGAVKCKNNY